jgi:protein SCO1
MKVRILLCLFVVSLLVVSGCGKKEIENATDWPIQEFTATNQDNKEISLKDLKGKIWVSDFIFTSCADVCPPMTSNMTKLQKKLKDSGLKEVKLVSFSVDPSVDSPEALGSYAQKFGADLSNWSLLTGYSQEFIEKFALKSFKALVKKPQEGNQVIHGTSFYLVDQNGHVKKSYDGYKDVPFEQIISDIKTLQ